MRRLLRIILSIFSGMALIVLVGWGVLQLGQFYLALLGKTPVQPMVSQSAGSRQSLQLNGFNVWYLQLGIFDNKANADKLVQQLASKGVKAVTLRGKPNRVAVGYLGKSEAARDARLLLALKGIKPIERKQVVNGISGTIAAGDGEQVKVILVNYGQILAAVAKEFAVEDPKQLTEQDLNQLVAQVSRLRQATVDPVQKLAGTSKRMIATEMTLTLDQQGLKLVQDLQGLAAQKNRQNYSKAQFTALQLLNTYWQYIDQLQEKPDN